MLKRSPLYHKTKQTKVIKVLSCKTLITKTDPYEKRKCNNRHAKNKNYVLQLRAEQEKRRAVLKGALT